MPRSTTGQRAAGSANVLMVDDQPARLLTYEAILSTLTVRCLRALSATEALEHLLKDEFAVILLDVHMPGMDGFELASLIREHPRLHQTPIIFITGVHVTEVDMLRGYQAGAVDYISVPVVPEILRSKVAVLVELHQRRSELQQLNLELAEARARVEADHVAAIARKDAQLRAVFEHPSDLTVVVRAVRDANGAVVDWTYRDANANAVSLLGRTRETLLGQRLSEVLRDRAAAAHERCVRVLLSDQPERYEARFGDRDFLTTIFPIGDECVVSSGVDITERKRIEAALRESERALKDADQRKDEFLAMLAHELRIRWPPSATRPTRCFVCSPIGPRSASWRRSSAVRARTCHECSTTFSTSRGLLKGRSTCADPSFL